MPGELINGGAAQLPAASAASVAGLLYSFRSLNRVVAAQEAIRGSIFPWDTFHPPQAWMRWFVLTNAHPGAILILHDRPDTLPATMALLRQVVPALRRRGYRFVTLERLLNT